MSDEPFQRPGITTPPAPEAWPYESPTTESVFEAPDVSMLVDHDEGRTEAPSARPPAVVHFRAVVVVGVVALLVGVLIGAVAIERPAPSAIPITVDSFPQELLGERRDDLAVREGEFKTAVESLDDHFQAQLEGYRFAYGGEGAALSYGQTYTLTIVNGRLAPEVPISDDPESTTPGLVSLNSGNTSCVARQTEIQVSGNDESGLPVDPTAVGDDPPDEMLQTLVATECVLFDRHQNLSVRLSGFDAAGDVFEAARRFGDELERINANLTT